MGRHLETTEKMEAVDLPMFNMWPIVLCVGHGGGTRRLDAHDADEENVRQ